MKTKSHKKRRKNILSKLDPITKCWVESKNSPRRLCPQSDIKRISIDWEMNRAIHLGYLEWKKSYNEQVGHLFTI